MPKNGRNLLTFGLPPPCKAKFKQALLCSYFVRRFIELPLRKTLEEVASGVFEYAGLNDEDAGDISLYYVQIMSIMLFRDIHNILYTTQQNGGGLHAKKWRA